MAVRFDFVDAASLVLSENALSRKESNFKFTLDKALSPFRPPQMKGFALFREIKLAGK